MIKGKHNTMIWQVVSDMSDIEEVGVGWGLELHVTNFGLLKGKKECNVI